MTVFKLGLSSSDGNRFNRFGNRIPKKFDVECKRFEYVHHIHRIIKMFFTRYVDFRFQFELITGCIFLHAQKGRFVANIEKGVISVSCSPCTRVLLTKYFSLNSTKLIYAQAA